MALNLVSKNHIDNINKSMENHVHQQFPITNILLHCKHLDKLYNEQAILMPIDIIDLCILVFFFQSKISILIFHQLQYKFFGCLEVFQPS
jgi:UDP-N-acetylglucosamine pyrophosphorylase